MSYKNVIAVAIMAVALVAPTNAFAREGESQQGRDGLRSKVEDTLQDVKEVPDQVVKEVESETEDHTSDLKDRVETRKAEIREKMEARAQENKSKLEGKMLAKCQNRQMVINDLINKSAKVGNAKLDRVKAFKEGIIKFYEDQGLASENYAAALENVNIKEGLAVAALEVMVDQDYDCATADATDPSQPVRDLRSGKREALKNYRDSVQELLKVVRKAFADAQGATDESE